MFTCKSHGHQDATSDALTDSSRGMGYDELVPELASDVSPSAVSKEAVPIQMGFVRFGGISVREALPDSGYSDTIAKGRL